MRHCYWPYQLTTVATNCCLLLLSQTLLQLELQRNLPFGHIANLPTLLTIAANLLYLIMSQLLPAVMPVILVILHARDRRFCTFRYVFNFETWALSVPSQINNYESINLNYKTWTPPTGWLQIWSLSECRSDVHTPPVHVKGARLYKGTWVCHHLIAVSFHCNVTCNSTQVLITIILYLYTMSTSVYGTHLLAVGINSIVRYLFLSPWTCYYIFGKIV